MNHQRILNAAMNRPFAVSSSTKLLWAALLFVLLGLWSSAYYANYLNEADTLNKGEADARNLARAFAEHTLASFQRVDLVLHTLRHEWVERPESFPAEVARHQALVSDMAFQLAVIGADGRMEFSNLSYVSDANDRVDLSDREHFRASRDAALRGEDVVFVSRPVLGRVSGKWAIQITRPIFRGQRFAGVLVISVAPRFFSRFYETVPLGPSSVVEMVRDSGEILSRAPRLDESLGKVLSDTPYLASPPSQSGLFRRRAQVDGVDRLFGYHRLPDFGVTLVVGVGVDQLLEEVREQQFLVVVIAGVFSVLLIALALAIGWAGNARRRSEAALIESEAKFRTLFESLPDLVFVVDTHARLTTVHLPQDGSLDGLDLSQWIGKPLVGALPSDVATTLLAACADLASDSVSRTLEFSLALAGAARDYQATLSPLTGAGNRPEGFVVVARDVTADKLIAESQRIAATTFESQEGMMVTDASGIILRVNRAFSELTGYAADEVVGNTPSMLKSGRQPPDFYRDMWRVLVREGYWQGEIWNRRKSGQVYPEWLTISAVCDESGKTTHYVGAFSDITERKEAETQIRNLAFYDPLTGLPNRRLMLDRLQQALLASSRSNLYGALLYLDLDHFKVLNDTRGHDAGDELLILVGERLRHAVREEDTVARLGGDEFVLMLEGLSLDEAAAANQAGAVAEAVRAAVGQSYLLKGGSHELTPSIGVSLFRNHEHSVDALLKQADMALYEAKEAGRNVVRFYSHAMQQSVALRATVLAGLRQALDRNEFELHLQPQFDARGRRLGAEALLRWHHPTQGTIAPAEFIPVAEDSGLIVPIGQWVLQSACRILAQWAADPVCADERLSVNVSARQFRQPDFVEVVEAALAESGADPSRLRLELTESAVLSDLEAAIKRMEKLKQRGISFSLDDFGTGYSSLSYLKRLPIDEVKIDQSFVEDLVVDSQNAAIVRAILAMCHSLGLDVIAEGVETEDQRSYLVSSGCNALQGFLLGRPVPLSAY